MRLLTAWCCALTIVGGLAASPVEADAQILVRVTDPAGTPLAGAHVALWKAGSRVEEGSTDARGTLYLRSSSTDGASAIVVYALGFSPDHRPIEKNAREVRAILHRNAVSLSAVAVSETYSACPQSDEPAARALWMRSKVLYGVPSLLARRTWMRQGDATIVGAEVGTFDVRKLWRGSRSISVDGMAGNRERIVRDGYAWRMPQSHESEIFGIWGYPPLTIGLAEHFGDADFGSRHSFRQLKAGASNDMVVLTFCATDRSRSGLDGRLELLSDGSMVRATWRYWNPARDSERAGGEVIFVPRGNTFPGDALLAARGVFWRRLPSGMFFQRTELIDEWKEL